MKTIANVFLCTALAATLLAGAGCAVVSRRADPIQRADQLQVKLDAARSEENRGRLEKARRMYVEIHQDYPQNVVCLHHLGNIATQLSRLDEAEGYYRLAYGFDSNNHQLLADMGYASLLRKDYEQSEALLEKSVRLNGNNRQAIKNLAIVRAWLEKDADSLAGFRSLFDEVESLRQLAEVQASRGDKIRSEKNFKLANRLIAKREVLASIDRSVPPQRVDADATPQVASTDSQAGDVGGLAPAGEIPPSPAHSEADPVQWASSAEVSSGVFQPPEGSVDLPPRVEFPDERYFEFPDEKSPSWTEAGGRDRAPSVRETSLILDMLPDPTAGATGVHDQPVSGLTRHASTELKAAPPVETSAPKLSAKISEWNIEETLAQDAAPRELPMETEAAQELAFERPIHWQKAQAQRLTPETSRPVLFSNPPGSSVMGTMVEAKGADDQSPLKGVCVVTLFEERRIASSSPAYTAEFQSQRYCFASERARARFLKEPQRYIPAAGGLDVVSVRNGKTVEAGSLEFGVWFHRRLYLFSSASHAEAFRREPTLYVTTN